MLYECSGNVIALNNPKRLAVIQGLKIASWLSPETYY